MVLYEKIYGGRKMDIPSLSPYAFKLGPIAVHWYGIFMAISIAVGGYYIYKRALKLNYSEDFLLNLSLLNFYHF